MGKKSVKKNKLSQKAKSKTTHTAHKKSSVKSTKKSSLKKDSLKAKDKKRGAIKVLSKAKTKKVESKTESKKRPQSKIITKIKSAQSKSKIVTPKVVTLKEVYSKDWSDFFVPLNNKILVVIDRALEKTPGGLYIPDSGKETPNTGNVVSVGHGKIDKKGRVHQLDVKVGDKVMFSHYGGQKFRLRDQDVVILSEDEVIGVTDNQ